MKKIGILTVFSTGFGYNMGGQLQSYALQKVINELGFHAEHIKEVLSHADVEKTFAGVCKYQIRYKLLLLLDHLSHNPGRKRVLSFENFRRKYIKTSRDFLYDEKSAMNLGKKYDYFIAGSDQVWNPDYFSDLKICLLAFADREKKISYAPSIGIDVITDEQALIYKTYLSDFEQLSCREKTGAKILENILHRGIPVLPDPTLLLHQEDWEKIEKKPNVDIGSKYVLKYFLGTESSKENEIILKRCKEYEVIDLQNKRDVYYSCGPDEFLYLIHHASLVLTDSFHACVFSFLFSIPFLVYERQGGNNMFSRIANFLETYDLQRKWANSRLSNELFECDYSKGYLALEADREKAFKFLKKALDVDNK